jgi:hypothetical protein
MPHLAIEYTTQHFWMGRRAAQVHRAEGLGGTLWKYGWGLLFVLVMTVLSEYGPSPVYSKTPPWQPVANAPAVRAVK